jgi:hypothetical protein
MWKEADMKTFWIYVLLMISLASCAGASSGHEGCNISGELCIGMQLQEPIIFGDPITITITVSSTIDVSNLSIYLNSVPQVLTEDLSGWVNHGVYWVINLEADQPQTFTKHILLPKSNGYFQIQTSANTPQLRAVYFFYIHQENGNSIVYYANTPIPYTQQPLPNTSPELLETLHAIPIPTHYPTLIPYPTITSTPISPAYPPPASPTSVWDAPGDTPYP